MANLESCPYSLQLLQKLKALDTKSILDFDLISKAIYWAKKYHGNQKRKSGELFYTHPLKVAYMVSDYNLKTDVIVASILHDIVEDTEVTAGMILDHFNWRIAEMVDRLTRDRPDGTKLSVEEILNNAYKLQDKEVLLVKLFDRIHNIQTIDSISIEKVVETANETLINFVLLSEYLHFTYTGRKIQQLSLEVYNHSDCKKIPYEHVFSFNDNYQPLSLAYQSE